MASDPSTHTSAGDEPWYWDLRRQRAVRASERGPADQLLGPYPTQDAAEHWRERVERRNEAWDDEDERWEGRHRDAAPDDDL
jgi:hypothetical protein